MRKPRSKAKKSEAAKAVGRVLLRRRYERKMTQEAFAELLGLSKNYMGNVERGEYEIGLSTLDRVAKILGLKMSELLAEAGL